MVKNGVGCGLDSLKAAFSWVLLLLMGFTLPASNKEGTKNNSGTTKNKKSFQTW